MCITMTSIYTIVFGYFITVTANCQIDCPGVCSCTDMELNHCSVVCTDQNLNEIPDYFPENTTLLDLSRNLITHIPLNNSLRHLKLLEVLKFDDNLLWMLLPDTFQGLWSLRELSLEYNRLTINTHSFPVKLFRNLTRVKILKLRGNIIHGRTYYLDYTISHLTALERLYMTGNEYSRFGSGYKNLSKLTYISFASKRNSSIMKYIENYTFQNVANIRHLDLSYCDLYHFATHSMDNFKYLEYLAISFNRYDLLKRIPITMNYLRNPSLFTTLSFNNMQHDVDTGTIIEEVFTSSLQKTSLKTVYLNSNRIELFAWNSIPFLSKTLEYVYLKNNILTYGEYIFQIKSLFRIKLIDISMTLSETILPLFRNKLFNRNITYSFTIPKSLQTLLLQGCQYKFPIPPFHIKDASSLQLINASNNLFCPWRGPLRGLEQLRILDLSHNQCNNISNEFFTFFSGLRVLNLESNSLGLSRKVAKGGFSKVFLNLTNLEEFHLSNNHIEYLSNNSLLYLRNLRILNLHNNLLRTFDVKISHMLNLSYLDLSGNLIHDLSVNTFNAIEKISENHNLTVNVQSNSLKCDCDQIKFLTWLYKVRRSARLKVMYTKCTHPNGTVWRLTDNRLPVIISFLNHSCSPFIGVIIAISFAVLMLIIFLVISLIYHFRWKLRYLYYMIRDKYSYKRITTDEYIYDAFVIYADENRDFALNYLIPELEEKEHLRLNIHHRDFPVGKLITENILSAIQSSRKCIILLSRYFLESKWCMFEYNLAKMEYIHTERNIVIIVVLEEIPHRLLPLPILEQIKNQSYIKFPHENEIAEVIFWKSLKHSIQIKD